MPKPRRLNDLVDISRYSCVAVVECLQFPLVEINLTHGNVSSQFSDVWNVLDVAGTYHVFKNELEYRTRFP